MTRKANVALLVAFSWLSSAAIAQESPTPPSPPEDSLLLRTPTPAPEASFSPLPDISQPAETPIPSPSVPPAHSARLRFVPAPMEGTISLGIFDEKGKLVRVLHREAKIDDFAADADSLSTTWDGKNDSGQDSPPGRYRARGYGVGALKVEDLGKEKKAPANGTDRISVDLVTNPLLGDTRSAVEIGVGIDAQGSFLRTTDGLPLFTISKTPSLARIAITKSGKKSADVWQDDGAAAQQFRVSNIDQLMAFDCGYFELR
jgi:hypothetical protein